MTEPPRQIERSAVSGAPLALRHILFRGLVLRLVVAVVLHVAISEATFAPDQGTYHEGGIALARYWTGETPVAPWMLRQSGRNGYFFVVAAQYLLFGPFRLLPKLVNAFVGTFTISLVFDIARRVAGNEIVALRAARFVAYFPSLVLWSVLNIRDVWVVLFILVISREAMRLQEGVRPGSLLLLSASVLAILQFRDYIFLAVVTPVLASFVVRSRGSLGRNAVIGLMVAAVVVFADRVAGTERGMRTIDLETLSELRVGTAVGGSGFERGVDISTPGAALAFLPKGLAYFLLAPFPWTIANLRQAITLPEMLFFYSLVPAIVRGVVFLVRHRLRDALMVIFITGAVTLGYALGQGNQGTAYRHRAQVLPFYLMFGALGIEVARSSRQRPLLGRPVQARARDLR